MAASGSKAINGSGWFQFLKAWVIGSNVLEAEWNVALARSKRPRIVYCSEFFPGVCQVAEGVGEGCFVAQSQQCLTEVSAWGRVCALRWGSFSRWSNHASRSAPFTC